MSRLIRVAVPLTVFAVGVVISPAGFAGVQGVAVPACAPVPQCELSAVDVNAANVGDNVDKNGGERGYSCLQSEAVQADAIVNGESGIDAAALACSYGGNSGTTWYKPRGQAQNGTPATGNFNHKYDNEEHVISCSECYMQTWMTNSSQSRTFYHDYKNAPGWVGYNFPRTAGRPFCQVAGNGTGSGWRNECYYVYG